MEVLRGRDASFPAESPEPQATEPGGESGLDAFASEASGFAETVTFPRFEPLPDDVAEFTEEVAAAEVPSPSALPVPFPREEPPGVAEIPPPSLVLRTVPPALPSETAPALPTEKPRSLRPYLLPGVLLALVALQSGPTFLWWQNRLATSTPALEEVDVAAAPAAAAEAPVEPAISGSAAASRRTAAAGLPAASGAAASRPAAAKPTPAAAPAPVGTASAAAPPAAAAPALSAGLLAVATPVPMHVYSKGKLIGTTEAETIMLPVGNHDLEFVSDDVGFRASRRVAVQAARTTRLSLDVPTGTVNINAAPWAEVWVDNKPVGETPIGNFEVPVGRREVRFMHPELGERRTTVLVTLKGTARVSMDLRE